MHAGAVASVETQHVPDLPRFGRYRALARLGAGTTGVVYRAEDEVLGRPVAIKVLHANSDPSTRERFQREARAFGAAPHANILAIYDAGTEGETPYLVMELAPGGSLREQIKAGPLAVDVVRRLGIQIARALAAAHAAGILHRDVKPANILAAPEDRWKLADFGIAHLPDSTLTITGQFLGSPSYAAPESLRAGEYSAASDVYGLGTTLYEALAGAPPHGDHDESSLLRKLEVAPPPLHERCAVPRPVADAIMAALELDPANRPSADELADLLAAIEDQPPAALPLPLPLRSRKRWLVGAAIAAAVLLLAILASGGSQPAASSKDPGSPSRLLTDGPREHAGSPAAAGQQAEPDGSDGADEADEAEPSYVDQNGNPVDAETARKILDERRGRDEDPGSRRGRGRWKKRKGRGD